MNKLSTFPSMQYDAAKRLRHMAYLAGLLPLCMLVVHMGIIFC
jgi:hypothetical protein